MTAPQLFRQLIAPYLTRWVLFAFLNGIAIALFITSLFLIEHIVKLLFQGNMDDCSVISTFFIETISRYIALDTNTESITWMAFWVVLFLLFKSILQFIGFTLLAPVKSGVLKNLRDRIYKKVLILPLSYYASGKRGNMISVATNDVQEVEFSLLKSFQQFLIDPITVIIYLTILFLINPYLTLFVLLFLPISGFLISLASRSLRKKGKKAKEILGETFAFIEETLSGLRVIKSFNAEHYFEGRFNKDNDHFAKVQTQIHRHVDLASPLSEVLGVTTVMVILVFGGYQILQSDSQLSAALFIVYMAIFAQVINPVKNVAAAFSNFRRGMAVLDRVVEILNSDEVILEDKNPIGVTTFMQQIEYRKVNFGYNPSKLVLENINFTIEKGKTYAIVGPSGAGKSTFIDLLPRFYDVTAGEILVDGVPIKKLAINQLRSLFAIVSQEVVLFNDTIRNNITYGLENITNEAVEAAARKAYAFDFIDRMPDRFETKVGDRGSLLSGGEKQRISLARAFLRNTPILILDEATSALDIESEMAIQKALQAIENKTLLIIAHRPTTIRNAEVVVTVVDQQVKIVE